MLMQMGLMFQFLIVLTFCWLKESGAGNSDSANTKYMMVIFCTFSLAGTKQL